MGDAAARRMPRVAAQMMFPALLGWVAGTALQLFQPRLWAMGAYAGEAVAGVLLLVVAWFLAARFKPLGTALLILLGMAGMAFAVTGVRAVAFQADALAPALEGRDVRVVGVVAAMPQRNDAALRFRLDLESAMLDGQEVALPPGIYLSWYSASLYGGDSGQMRAPPLQAGERWQLTVRLKAPHGGANPFGFDYELWMWEQGLQASGYVRAGPRDVPPQRLGQTNLHPLERARQQVRDAIFERLARAPVGSASDGDEDFGQQLREQQRRAGVVAALVVGDQSAIDRADWDVFRATGIAHLVSISGLHITMFAWAAARLLGWLWRRSPRLCLRYPAPSAGLLGGVLLASAYALFSGWGVPSQRTICMLATASLLRLMAKRWPWGQVWLLAGVVVVTADPWALLQAGFWLSFVAVGVLFATDPGSGAGALASDAPPWRRLAARLLAGLQEQWVITVALTPLTLLLFGQVSLVGLAANALAIPWVTLVVTPLAMLGVLVAPLWDAAAWAVHLLSIYLAWLLQMPLATVSIAQAPLWAGAVGVLGGLLLVLRGPWRLRLLGAPLLLPALLWAAPLPGPGHFELLAADIGQGNAVLVRTAHHALLYDAGPRFSKESDAGHRVLVPLLRALDVKLDTLVLSHRDADHVGGAAAVRAMQPQAALLSSVEQGPAWLALPGGSRCEAGLRWQWDGVDFEVLHPLAEDYGAAQKSNALSCTLRISNGRQAALLAGDLEAPQEALLVARSQASGTPLQADVLLAPHHGSKTSSSAVLLDAVAPRFVLVQAGYRNRFGHPAAPVLARYGQRHIRVVDSPHCGASVWRSAQPDEVQCQRQLQARYWLHELPEREPAGAKLANLEPGEGAYAEIR
jgi:competence protein ComEC